MWHTKVWTLFGSLPELHMTHKSSKCTKTTICSLMKTGDFQNGIMSSRCPLAPAVMMIVVFLQRWVVVYFQHPSQDREVNLARDHIFRFPSLFEKNKKMKKHLFHFKALQVFLSWLALKIPVPPNNLLVLTLASLGKLHWAEGQILQFLSYSYNNS